MKEYNKLKFIVLFVIVFYFFAGLSTEIFLSGREKDFPPFFSWFLFDTVPNEKYTTKYTLLIVDVNGKLFNPPVFYNQAKGIVKEPDSPKARDLIRYLATSLVRNDSESIERYRKLLEQIYLPRNTHYEVVAADYNPIVLFKTGKYEKIEKLEEFKTN